MAADSGTNWWPLVIGGGGALIAIFLKEAVQTAIKRQTLLAQLNAYVLHWNRHILRSPEVYEVFKVVRDREDKLLAAVSKGKEAFHTAHNENVTARDELRKKIKDDVTKYLSGEEGLQALPWKSALLPTAKDAVTVTRQYLMDNKTFISDSDAAYLGPRIANATVSFRSSAVQISLAFEGLIRILHEAEDENQRKDLATLSSHVVDSFVLDGEDLLASLVRLERYVDEARQRMLLLHVLDILRGR
jgi:hypothetical protein